MKVDYVRLYSDSNGASHFSVEHVEVKPTDFAPPTPPLYLSAFAPATRIAFLKAPANWVGDWHPAPRRQFMILLSGETDVRASDGEKRHFKPGDALLLEDTTGIGHYTESGSALIAVVQLPEDAELFP